MMGGKVGPESGDFISDWPAGVVMRLHLVSEYSCNWPIRAHLSQGFVFSSRAVYRLCTFSPTTSLPTDIPQEHFALTTRQCLSKLPTKWHPVSTVTPSKLLFFLKLTDERFKAPASRESKHERTSSADSILSLRTQHELKKDAEVAKIYESLDRFSFENLSELIIKAAKASPTTRSLMITAVDKERQKQQSKIIYFDHYLKSIVESVSVKDVELGSENKSVVALKIVDEVSFAINDIVRNAGPYANPDTHYNALATLRDISSAIASATAGTVGHEVQLSFRGFTALEKGMLAVLHSMSYEEKFEIRSDEDPDAMWAKMVDAYRLANKCGVFDNFREVLNAIEGDGEFVTDDEGSDDEDFIDGDEDMEDYDQDYEDGENEVAEV